MSRGIDYGMGRTNINPETGIRFGVISRNSGDLTEWVWEGFEGDYGTPTCRECGGDAIDYDDEKHGEYKAGRGCADYACEHCERVIDSSDAYNDEPNGHDYNADGYVIRADSYGDAFVIRSPFFTRAGFCSPCAPGACHLESPTDDGERCYCLGHDWFRDGVAPYPVYSVETGELVPAPSK